MAKKKSKKIRRDITRGIAHIKATFNNTQITITDMNSEAREGRALPSRGPRGIRAQRRPSDVRVCLCR